VTDSSDGHQGAPPERLRHLTSLRRVRDRIDREYARPLDVEALARGAHQSAGPGGQWCGRLQEPTDQPYGVRDCAFRDPTGNLLRINEQP
jgi:catechol 2,3-dioxygenase-like lactoylglutathione lyase family enzyme